MGHGSWGYESCDPNCAQGSVTPYPTTISLSDPVSGRFTQVTETQSGPHGNTFNFTLPEPRPQRLVSRAARSGQFEPLRPRADLEEVLPEDDFAVEVSTGDGRPLLRRPRSRRRDLMGEHEGADAGLGRGRGRLLDG